jgi:SAM-dependent methyltransferase
MNADGWDQQFKDLTGAKFFPHEETVRFLGRTYGHPWPPYTRCQDFTAGEIGCGAGGNLRALHYWGFNVLAIDISEEAAYLAESVINQDLRDTDFVMKEDDIYVAGAIALPWYDASLDLVIDIQCIQHLDNEEHALAYGEVARVLKSGGTFFSVHWKRGDQKFFFPAHRELAIEWSTTLLDKFMPTNMRLVNAEGIQRTALKGQIAQWHVLEWRKA